ncbi:MAG: sigma factor-like helix-turn-helix DNA-binding protein [Eubacteriales bacterium]
MNKIININIDKLDEKTQEVIKLALRLHNKDIKNKLVEESFYDYINKAEEKLWNNKNRNYYIHNVSLEGISQDIQVRENILKDCSTNIEMKYLEKEIISEILEKLNKLTLKQRKRFLMHYYYGMSLTEISKKEKVSISSIIRTLKQVTKKIEN